MSVIITPLSRGGVLAGILVNTPLHPSQEGNRRKELMNAH
jgi:hypothetical protein